MSRPGVFDDRGAHLAAEATQFAMVRLWESDGFLVAQSLPHRFASVSPA